MRAISRPETPHPTPARYSLRWRLPLIMAASLGLVIAAFLAVAYQEVKGKLVQAAGTRAQATADQLAGLFAQSTQQRLNELQRIAAHATIRKLLEHPDEETRDAASRHLGEIRSPVPQIVEVWNTGGECVLSLPAPATAVTLLPAGSAPSGPGVAPLQRRGDQVFGESTAEILPESAVADPRGSGPRAPLGFLVVRRPLNAAPTVDLLNRLVGQGATISLGNKTGDVWTDLAKLITPPAIDMARPGIAESSGANGRSVGALTDVRGTPWAMWVEFPHTVVLAPARAFFQRMVIIALGFVVLSAIGIRIVSARITTPLHELTLASEAIAAGDYARRVTSSRRDELGRLSLAFNAMAQQVQSAHGGLEEGVRQRTAKLQEASVLLEQRVHDAKAAREELDRFFSLSLDLLCIADSSGRFTRLNPAWQEVLGWTPEELTAVPYADFVHPDDRATTSIETTNLRAGGQVFNFENRYRHKDGSYRWLSWKAAAQADGAVVYATARDITEQKRAARTLEQNVVELAAVNRELEAFSYSVSHDLRAPLRHITGFAMMLQQSASATFDAEGRRYLKTIMDAATRMGRLIDDLLAFSRVGRQQLARSPVDLNRVVQEAKHEVSADINGRAVSWRVQELPTVEGDPSLLHLVFVNLLSNALKYSSTRPRTEIEVGVLAQSGTEAVVFVRDNGVGFDMQYADKLFGVFQRLHSGDDFEGTGIGLANVRRIVQRHGGRSWADGEVDHGATFYVALPNERTSDS
jgi:PAS domain S-box-containing protein